MIRGLYIGASGMLAAQHRNDVVADNLANVNTPGFKSDTAVNKTFARELMVRLENDSAGGDLPKVPQSGQLGVALSGVALDLVAANFTNGPLVQTGNSTDLALNGPGLFVVSTPDGQRFTRCGAFGIDASGNLVTSQGYPVMGTEGPLKGFSTGDFEVSSNGIITQGDVVLGKLMVVDLPTADLRKEGNNLFSSQTAPNSLQTISVKQKFLEQSNVDVAKEMGSMISAMREYEANQKVIQTMDTTLEKAANEIGKL